MEQSRLRFATERALVSELKADAVRAYLKFHSGASLVKFWRVACDG